MTRHMAGSHDKQGITWLTKDESKCIFFIIGINYFTKCIKIENCIKKNKKEH